MDDRTRPIASSNSDDVPLGSEPDEKFTDGALLAITPQGVLGWAWNPASPDTQISVTLIAAGQVVGAGVADIFDNEVVRRRAGPGKPGFLITLSELPQVEFPLDLELFGPEGARLGAPLRVWDQSALTPITVNPKGQYEGHVDGVEAGSIVGWAWSPTSPNQDVMVELYEGDNCIDRVRATEYREDLAQAGKKGGHCGFHIDLPVWLLDDTIHCLTVRLAKSDFKLPGSAIRFGPLGASAVFDELVALRAEVGHLREIVDRIASPNGELQRYLVRTLSERVSAVLEVQREAVARELDALRSIALKVLPAAIQNGSSAIDRSDSDIPRQGIDCP